MRPVALDLTMCHATKLFTMNEWLTFISNWITGRLSIGSNKPVQTLKTAIRPTKVYRWGAIRICFSCLNKNFIHQCKSMSRTPSLKSFFPRQECGCLRVVFGVLSAPKQLCVRYWCRIGKLIWLAPVPSWIMWVMMCWFVKVFDWSVYYYFFIIFWWSWHLSNDIYFWYFNGAMK